MIKIYLFCKKLFVFFQEMESKEAEKSSSTFSLSHSSFFLTATIAAVVALISLILGYLINIYNKKRKEKAGRMNDDCNCNYTGVEETKY